MKISEVEGQFRRFEGKLEKQGDQIKSLEIKIDSRSIDTNNNIRDAHLQESSFLYSSKYPYIIITYDQNNIVIKVKDKIIKKPIEISKLIQQTDAWGKISYFQKVVETISLEEFDFNWNKTLPGGEMLLGDQIEITAVFQWQDPNLMTAASKHKIPDTKALRKIKFEGDRYKGLEPEMVAKKKRVEVNREDNKEMEIKPLKMKPGLSEYIMFFIGFISVVGFYLVSRLSLVNKRKVGLFLDLFFISLLTAYLVSAWNLLV